MSHGARRQQCVREPGASSVSGRQAGSNKPGAREPAVSQGPTNKSGSQLASNVSMSRKASKEQAPGINQSAMEPEGAIELEGVIQEGAKKPARSHATGEPPRCHGSRKAARSHASRESAKCHGYRKPARRHKAREPARTI